ncbi:MAG: transcription antitermination factor NusB [Pseudomonadota bacterium]
MEAKAIPLSLLRKSSARLAAVQCIYQIKINDASLSPEELCSEYIKQWQDDKVSPNRAMSFDKEPDKKLFLKILAGTIENKEEIENIIKASLNDKWAFERISKLLTSIIACAIFEMKFSENNLKPAIIINEYVTITGRFFEENDVGFVNGLLDSLSKAS